MKWIMMLVWLVFCGEFLGAQAFPDARVTSSRTLVQMGVLITKGDDTGWDRLGYGLSYRSFFFLDPSQPEGWYFGFLSTALSRSAGGITLADTRLVTLGWRGDPFGWQGKHPGGLQADVNLSPTVGARIQGTTIFGAAYTGIGLTLGLALPIFDGQDLGLSWEPVFPVTAWGAVEAPNRGYSDFVVSWTLKLRSESRSLPWNG